MYLWYYSVAACIKEKGNQEMEKNVFKFNQLVKNLVQNRIVEQ